MTFQPLERSKFQIRLHGGIYMPERIVPTEVRMYGGGYFLFEPTEQNDVLSVKIEEISLRVIPFTFAFDIDGDGLLESFEIRELNLSEFVDLDATTGLLNVESGEFQLEWVFQVTPTMIPFLNEIPLLNEPMTIHVPDRGYLDPETGEFEIHRGVFEIDAAPLRGMLIRGSGEGCVGGHTLELGVAMAGMSDPCSALFEPGVELNKKVWACPRDSIIFCWQSYGTTCNGSVPPDSVSIEPGGLVGLPNGRNPVDSKRIITVPDNYSSNPIEYEAKLLDSSGNVLARDKVEVHIYEDQWLTLSAQPDGIRRNWSVTIPPLTHSSSITVKEIQLIDNPSECLNWFLFMVEHTTDYTYPGVTKLWGTEFKEKSVVYKIAPSRPILGTWEFYGMNKKDKNDPKIILEHAPDPKDYKVPVCFRLRGTCKK